MKTILRQFIWLMLLPAAALAADPDQLAADRATLSEHQDSSHLGYTTSAVMPADGLMSVELGFRKYTTVYQLNDLLETISQFDTYLRTELGPFPWL